MIGSEEYSMAVLRISRSSFKPENYERVKARLDGSHQTLAPAVRNLTGCLHYWAGIDRTTGTMVNVSVWKSLEDAKQMDTLAPMLALAVEFTGLGVVFERPIANYELLWQV